MDTEQSQAEQSQAVVVATLAALPAGDDARRDLLASAAGHAQVLEVRADLVGDLEPAALRPHFPGLLLYTLRSRAEGGGFDGGDERRHERLLAAAAAGWDVVDLEGARDLVPPLLEALPAARRLVSWHGEPADLVELEERFEACSGVPARLYKLVVFARQPGDEIAPLLLAAGLGRRDLLAFAAGRGAAWTRLVAPYLGARVVFGAATGAAAGAPGQLTVEELARDYGLPRLPPVERLFGIVGDPVLSSSLSPRLHNAAYRALGYPGLFLPFETQSFGDFWLEVVESVPFERVGLPLAAFAVTAPYKRAALAVAGAMSPLAECIGAVNTLVRREGVWEAESTDPAGILGPLAERGVEVAGRRAAVVGCGGAGRAAAVGLARAGAEVTLVNRNLERGRETAAALALPFVALAELSPRAFPLVVHATSLGGSDGDALPFDLDGVGPGLVLVDLVYRHEGPTRLVAEARRRGAVAVDGREVLLHQAVEQFRRMTGAELPVELGRRVLGLEPGA